MYASCILRVAVCLLLLAGGSLCPAGELPSLSVWKTPGSAVVKAGDTLSFQKGKVMTGC